jgi:hypothetical protein
MLGVSASYIGTFNRNLPLGRDVNYPVVSARHAAAANVLPRRLNRVRPGADARLDQH